MTSERAPSCERGELPAVDLPHLSGFTDGDLELERELAELYLSTADVYLDQLAASLDDPEAWRKAAHALKGASANLGARIVAERALAAEQQGPAASRLDLLRSAVDEVRTFFERRSP